MAIDKNFFLGMMKASQEEVSLLGFRMARQEGVVAFCELIIKKIEEDEKGAPE